MAVTVYSSQVTGMHARPIVVEVDITPGLHTFSIVGLADKEVQESRERIGSAIKHIGAVAPNKKSQRVVVNLAPAHLKKEGPAFDLAIALGYLLASEQIRFESAGILFVGELGLDGAIRRIPGILPITLAAKAHGYKTLILPKSCGREAAIVRDIAIYEAAHLRDVVEHLMQRKLLPQTPATLFTSSSEKPAVDFSNIKGQETAKRALEIAAAGGHNVLLSGPPGSGKTLLAHALAGILPPLTFTELLEVTNIYSVTGLLDHATPLVTTRPFRNPHHTASYTSIVGGGKYPRPGEITLAHRGVLFLDELPEFDRRVIESLRQPLEERTITITRIEGAETFPAQLILIAAMNPCPCGYYESGVKDCVCGSGEILRYRKKISGPLLDRIDIHITVPHIPYEKLEQPAGESSVDIRTRVVAARAVQRQRFQNEHFSINAEAPSHHIERVAPLNHGTSLLLKAAHERHHLSLRAHYRILKLARTIADLSGSQDLGDTHILEALRYRLPDYIA